MIDRNIEILYETLKAFRSGRYPYGSGVVTCRLTPEQRSQAHVYLPEDVTKIAALPLTPKVNKTEYGCCNMDSFTAARKRIAANAALGGPLKRVLVLNLANPVNPGGGVRHGAKAQEEDLCRKSSLLFSLTSEAAAPYYEYNRGLHSNLASHALVLSPRVEIIRDESGAYLSQSSIVSVLTCAAPMVRYGLEGMTEESYHALLYDRIYGMLRCAAFWGYDSLILGAFGCGAFGNDAQVVAQTFAKALHSCDNQFSTMEFAVLDHSPSQYNFQSFAKIFKKF